jgi:hypothetical protein
MASRFIFVCACGATRIYGSSEHSTARPNPLSAIIRCASCNKTTWHTFLGLEHMDGRADSASRYLSKWGN